MENIATSRKCTPEQVTEKITEEQMPVKIEIGEATDQNQEDEEQSCWCFKCILPSPPPCLRELCSSIAVVALLKSIFSLVVFVYDIISKLHCCHM